jgi:hypothetical protein
MAQGPVLIFDKSSLESLSLDEAVLLDGELVALGPDGRPDFHLLQRQKSLGELPVCHAFLVTLFSRFSLWCLSRYQTNQDHSMVNAGGLCRSLDSSHGEEISEQTTFAVKGL